MVSRTKPALENIALQLETKNTGKTAFIFLVRLGFRFSDCGNYTNKHEVFSQLLELISFSSWLKLSDVIAKPILAYTSTLIICSLKRLMIIQVVNMRDLMLQRSFTCSPTQFLRFIQLLAKRLHWINYIKQISSLESTRSFTNTQHQRQYFSSQPFSFRVDT